nr:hypothetical protein [Candidatus Freyrarchaeum guaymaensis]
MEGIGLRGSLQDGLRAFGFGVVALRFSRLQRSFSVHVDVDPFVAA